MRSGLAITLLGDGYFGFDEGDCLHGQLWWFPEYDANLGLAKRAAQERGDCGNIFYGTFKVFSILICSIPAS